MPGQQGVFGFGDVGRVFYTGETSDQLHTSIGGGIWLAFLNRGSLVSLAVGHSREGNRIRVGAGFAF